MIKNINFQARKTLLIYEGSPWTKKNSPGFDVPMGGYDGAEVCDIVGLFLLSELEKLNENANLGCYKDDGLGVSTLPPQQIEKLKKRICETYQRHGLQITIQANQNTVQYLDVEFNLKNESYKPYIKPGDTPLYVHIHSNHPPSIKRNIPEAINRRLSNLSPVYQEALKK